MPYIHEGPPLYLAEDRRTVVEADSLRAAYLLVATGGTLPDDLAKRHGLPREQAAAAESEPEKAAASKPNKAKTGPSHKAQE